MRGIDQALRMQDSLGTAYGARKASACSSAHILVEERTELLQKNKAEIDALFEKRRQMEETEFLERRQERERGARARPPRPMS